MAKEAIFSGDRMISLVKQLIRYDIPFLLLGKSSIGKSYSVIEMTKRWRMPKSLLYIGSEKPSNIEGLPRLTGTRAGGDTLEFYKPNWFPNTYLIEAYVTNGKKLIDEYLTGYYDGDKAGCQSGKNFPELHNIFEGLGAWDWESNISTKEELQIADVSSQKLADSFLNKKGFPVERQLYSDAELFKLQNQAYEAGEDGIVVRDDIRDMCLYLSTLLGYGNYWLILDELDKVDESEQDKYAPLLHIVRERIIKDYSMRTLNEGKGAGVPRKVLSGGDYSGVKGDLDKSIDLKMPLLDTRIIGIANATADIEDALFRRFCHLIVEEIMYVTPPSNELKGMRDCLAEVASDSNAEALLEGLDFKLLNEVNLQWQFGFLPTMTNKNDAFNNYIYQDFMLEYGEAGLPTGTQNAIMAGQKSSQEMLYSETKSSALFKIIRNNFGVDDDMTGGQSMALQKGIYRCLAQAMIGGSGVASQRTEGVVSQKTTEEVELSAMQQRIADALEASDGNAEDATTFLLAEQQEKIKDANQNTKQIEWLRETFALVEASKETSLFEPMLKQFYPIVLLHIATHAKNEDTMNKNLVFLNEFIQGIQDDLEIYEVEGADKVSDAVLSKLNMVRALTFVMGDWSNRIAPTIRGLKKIGDKKSALAILSFMTKKLPKFKDKFDALKSTLK